MQEFHKSAIYVVDNIDKLDYERIHCRVNHIIFRKCFFLLLFFFETKVHLTLACKWIPPQLSIADDIIFPVHWNSVNRTKSSHLSTFLWF